MSDWTAPPVCKKFDKECCYYCCCPEVAVYNLSLRAGHNKWAWTYALAVAVSHYLVGVYSSWWIALVCFEIFWRWELSKRLGKNSGSFFNEFLCMCCCWGFVYRAMKDDIDGIRDAPAVGAPVVAGDNKQHNTSADQPDEAFADDSLTTMCQLTCLNGFILSNIIKVMNDSAAITSTFGGNMGPGSFSSVIGSVTYKKGETIYSALSDQTHIYGYSGYRTSSGWLVASETGDRISPQMAVFSCLETSDVDFPSYNNPAAGYGSKLNDNCQACRSAGGTTYWFHQILFSLAAANLILLFTRKNMPTSFFMAQNAAYFIIALVSLIWWNIVCGGSLSDYFTALGVKPAAYSINFEWGHIEVFISMLCFPVWTWLYMKKAMRKEGSAYYGQANMEEQHKAVEVVGVDSADAAAAPAEIELTEQ